MLPLILIQRIECLPSVKLVLATTCLEVSRPNVSHKGKISCQKRKIAIAKEAAGTVDCSWSRPDSDAPFACRLDMYIILLFTSGSSAPSFLAPNTF